MYFVIDLERSLNFAGEKYFSGLRMRVDLKYCRVAAWLNPCCWCAGGGKGGGVGGVPESPAGAHQGAQVLGN